MNGRDEFEKWADQFDHESRAWPDMGNDKVFEAGWQARQPEIDALIHDNKQLYESLNAEAAECTRLKAENERLRKLLDDAKEDHYNTSMIPDEMMVDK